MRAYLASSRRLAATTDAAALVDVSAHGSADDQNCRPASTMRSRHVPLQGFVRAQCPAILQGTRTLQLAPQPDLFDAEPVEPPCPRFVADIGAELLATLARVRAAETPPGAT